MRQLLFHHRALERQTALVHAGLERARQGIDEGVVFLAVEGVKAVVEPANPDGIEGNRGHVMDDVNVVIGIHPLPLEAQLTGHIQHHGEIIAHRLTAKGRQQDVVRLAPVRFLGVAGKETVAPDGTDPAQGAAHRLVKAAFVAQLIHQFGARHDDQRRAHHVHPNDRSQLAGQTHQALQRFVLVDRENVSNDRLFLWHRNAFELHLI